LLPPAGRLLIHTKLAQQNSRFYKSESTNLEKFLEGKPSWSRYSYDMDRTLPTISFFEITTEGEDLERNLGPKDAWGECFGPKFFSSIKVSHLAAQIWPVFGELQILASKI
jgi:hypothetical protein